MVGKVTKKKTTKKKTTKKKTPDRIEEREGRPEWIGEIDNSKKAVLPPRPKPKPQGKVKTGRPMGSPHRYKPEYCKLLVDHMSKGFSFESFAGVVHVSRKTIYNWLDPQKNQSYQEFLHAKQIGAAKCQEFWERVGINGALGEIRNFSASSYIFNMKNRFGWRDRIEQEQIVTNFEPMRINLPQSGEQIAIEQQRKAISSSQGGVLDADVVEDGD